jgi:hypothetical protein
VTEPTPERLQEAIDRYGFTEQEARIFVYLEEAEKLLLELTRERSIETSSGSPMPRLGSIIWKETHMHEHFSALRRELALSVLSRDYPQGWGYIAPEQNDED